MKSKIKFDINHADKPMVSAQIIFESDDLRDKVARSFYEGLGHESNLAYVQILPETEIKGLKNEGGMIVDASERGRNLHIYTYKGDQEGSEYLCSQLCTEQLTNLMLAAKKEIEQRDNTKVIS